MKQDKLEEIGTQLIAQEHRTWSILKNFHKYAFSKDKTKSRASIFTLIFNLILSKSTLAIAFTGFIGYYFAWKNIDLIEKQNEIIKEQSHLSEASRRGSLVFLSSNIYDKIDEELKAPGNYSRSLSEELIGRIASLSYAL